MVTVSRSENLFGPFESNPANPILTNTNTTSLCKWGAYLCRSPTDDAQSKQSGMRICSRIRLGTGLFPDPESNSGHGTGLLTA